MKMLLILLLVVMVIETRRLHKSQRKDHLRFRSYRRTRNHMNRSTKEKPIKLEDLPIEFDSRTEFKNCTGIRDICDQGDCDSCWAVAITSMLNDRTCIKNNGNDSFKYSAHNLLSCCDKKCGDIIKGGRIDEALEYWEEFGIVSEKCQPYWRSSEYEKYVDYKKNPKCEHYCSGGRSFSAYFKSIRKGGRYTHVVQSEVAIMKEIKYHGPVVANMEIYESFQTEPGKDVYYTKIGKWQGNHSVRILGWGKQDVDVPYWLVANSYGKGCHCDGVFKIRRGSNFCGIEESVFAAYPKSE